MTINKLPTPPPPPNGETHRDCLNTIRLIAALEVLYGHTIEHLGIARIPIFSDIIGFIDGVPIFLC